ncbi:MAG: hypothetical protein JO251_15000 [Verrucomicrobia bacterium]|nr:hypothetical protein [Verrucomicrobiota bacterium]
MYKEDLDEYAHHIASPGGLRGMLGVYRTIAAEAQDLSQLTHTKLTVPVWAVGGAHSMGMGPFEQFHHLAKVASGYAGPFCCFLQRRVKKHVVSNP